jgi:hypothetical protein
MRETRRGLRSRKEEAAPEGEGAPPWQATGTEGEELSLGAQEELLGGSTAVETQLDLTAEGGGGVGVAEAPEGEQEEEEEGHGRVVEQQAGTPLPLTACDAVEEAVTQHLTATAADPQPPPSQVATHHGGPARQARPAPALRSPAPRGMSQQESPLGGLTQALSGQATARSVEEDENFDYLSQVSEGGWAV